MTRLLRLLTPIASIAVIVAGTTTALAQQDGYLWEHFPATHDAPASVSLHDPETGIGLVSAACGEDRELGMAVLTIAARAGTTTGTATSSPAPSLVMRFSSGGEELLLRSRITIPVDDSGMAGVTTTLPLDHALWKMIDRSDVVAAGLPGHVPTILPLAGAHDAIRDFLDNCGHPPLAAQSVPEAPAATDGGTAPDVTGPVTGETVQDAFEFALNLNTAEAWQSFLKVYPDGFYGELARTYLQKLQDQQTDGAEDAALERPPQVAAAQRYGTVPRAKPHKARHSRADVKRGKSRHHKHHQKIRLIHLLHNSLESTGRIRYSCRYLSSVCRNKPAGICTLPCF